MPYCLGAAYFLRLACLALLLVVRVAGLSFGIFIELVDHLEPRPEPICSRAAAFTEF
jgi:hypothetical protein